jgi:hypothetical protein
VIGVLSATCPLAGVAVGVAAVWGGGGGSGSLVQPASVRVIVTAARVNSESFFLRLERRTKNGERRTENGERFLSVPCFRRLCQSAFSFGCSFGLGFG